MPKHQDKKIMPFPPGQIYDLVADVARYPEFLPWCVGARIREQSDVKMVADLIIGWKMIRESFTSDVQLVPKSKIDVQYRDGPFRYLTNSWQFDPLDGDNKSCVISFYVDFEFRSPLLKSIMEPLFMPAVQKMMAAFEKRAADLYGR